LILVRLRYLSIMTDGKLYSKGQRIGACGGGGSESAPPLHLINSFGSAKKVKVLRERK